MSTPRSAREELESLSEDELDFLEREVFYAYDEAYAAYEKEDMDNLEEIALYERALDTISKIRRIKDEIDEETLRQAKEIRELIDKDNNSEI